MRFAVSEIKEQEGLTFSGPFGLDEFAAEGLFGEAKPEGPCAVDLEFSVGGSSILMEGRIEVRWRVACNRCLELHLATAAGELEETYPISAETVDVTEEVRQALVLSLPERSLCREDCKGLCPRCGGNLNEGSCRCQM